MRSTSSPAPARSVRPPTTGDAVRALRLLTCGVGADGGTGDDGAGLHDHVAAGAERDRESVHAARGGAALLLTDLVVLRPVTGALEPLARHALRDPAAEVRALLVEGDDALLHDAEDVRRVHGTRLGQRVGRVRRDPGAGGRSVEEPLPVDDALLDVVELADVHRLAEPPLRGRPQEGDEAGGGERADPGAHQ